MKNLRKYAVLYALIVIAMGAPTLMIYFLWPLIARIDQIALALVLVGGIALIRLEYHLWPILRDWIKEL